MDDLESKITKLQKELDDLRKDFKSHRHADTDKSASMIGNTPIRASTVTIYGGPVTGGTNIGSIPLQIVDNSSGTPSGPAPKTRSVFGASVLMEGRGTPSEQIDGGLVSGVISQDTSIDSVNQSELILTHSTQSDLSFFTGLRTPIFSSTPSDGVIQNGGYRLVSSSGGFTAHSFIGATLHIYDSSQNYLEAQTILDNDTNHIFITGMFSSTSGSYRYEIRKPIYLGAADVPWRRLYVQGDQLPGDAVTVNRAIRIGSGPTFTFGPSGFLNAGPNSLWIMSGIGSPNTFVAAKSGSIYLNASGGTSTTLYVKEADAVSGDTTKGWVAK